MGKIRWTEKASSNLENIHRYIANDSILFASEFILNLMKETNILIHNPKSGRIVPELRLYGFRELIRKGHRIVYRILNENDDIEILAVVHSSRNLN